MKKSQLALYPPNWNEIAKACKERAGWRCEKCGASHRTWRQGRKLGSAYQIRIAAAHLDHDPGNPEPRLMALCNQCHLQHDGLEHGKKAHQTKCQKRREAEMQAGQLELILENEQAVEGLVLQGSCHPVYHVSQ